MKLQRLWVPAVALAMVQFGGCGKSDSGAAKAKADKSPAGQAQADLAKAGLKGYTVLASVGEGRTLFTQKTDAKTAQAAALATLRDLARVFDEKPAVSGAFGDDKDRRCWSTFTANLKGQAMKGFLACGVDDKGAAITVVYARADAPSAEVSQLTAALPTSKEWVVHPLPGGSGTIKYPPDWKVTREDKIGGVTVEGPQGQSVALGVGGSVITPDSPMAQMAYNAGTLLVGPFQEPAKAIENLMPQISRMSQKAGGPALAFEKLVSSEPCAAFLPNGKAALITYDLKKTAGREVAHLRQGTRLECYQLGSGGWAFYSNSVTAPAAIYERDLPMMMAIGQSWTLNDQAVQGNARDMINAQNRSFAALQQSMKEKNAAFDSYMQSVQNASKVREKCNADFDEVIRGTRTVEDTMTGERKDVDLGYSKEIVDKLNEKEGYSRYHEIPLRDQ